MPSTNSTAHTAGPWKCERDNHFGLGFVITSASAGMTNRCPVVRLHSPCGELDETLEADARLIAASPDLLAACEAAEEWLSGWASAEPYLTTIRAAIAAAKGGAS